MVNKLDTEFHPTDIQEFWTEFQTFMPVVLENSQPAVLWRTICEMCGDTIRLTLRKRVSDIIGSPAHGQVIESKRFECSCSSLW